METKDTYELTIELTPKQHEWLVAEAELNELLNELDTLPEGSDEQRDLDSHAASKAAAITEMGFTNEHAFKIVLELGIGLRSQQLQVAA